MATLKTKETKVTKKATENTAAEQEADISVSPETTVKKTRSTKKSTAKKPKTTLESEAVSEPNEDSTVYNEEIETVETNRDDSDEEAVLSGRVITRSGAERTLSQDSFSLDESYARILTVRREKTVCMSKVAAIRKKSETVPFDTIIMDYRGIPVSIALDDFFDEDEKRNAELSAQGIIDNGVARQDAIRSRLLTIARQMLGANVPFIIIEARKAVDKDVVGVSGKPIVRFAVRGSRNEALKKIREKHFFSPRAQANPIHAGDVLVCDVLRTVRDAVIVSCCGVTTRLFRRDLSATRWCEPRADFVPGQSFKAAVREISIDHENKKVSLSLDRKYLDGDAADTYLRMLNESHSHNRFTGTIAYVAQDRFGNAKFYGINLDAVALRALVPVKYNNYQSMKRGDPVVFEVRRVDMDAKVLVGVCDPLGTYSRNNW